MRAPLQHIRERDDPAVLAPAAFDDHDPVDLGQAVAHRTQLVGLLVILGDHHPAGSVTDDERALVCGAGRVDGSRRTAGGQHRKVGQDPLDAGARQDRDAILVAHTKAAQPPGEDPYLATHVTPDKRPPPVLGRIPQRFGLGCCLDSTVEERRDGPDLGSRGDRVYAWLLA